MKADLRLILKSLFSGIVQLFSNLLPTFISILRIFILSKISIAWKTKSYFKIRKFSSCIVLANGPSLKNVLDNNEIVFEGKDVVCMNLFVMSEYFWKIKPKFYYIVDEVFFNPRNDRERELVEKLCEKLNKVTWNMYLCVSSTCSNRGVWSTVNNPQIKILRWNTTKVEGLRSFCHFMYKNKLGMPRCQTVANFAIFSAVLMGYNKIYVYGIDHSWTKDLMVDENNMVCYGDRHVYDTKLTILKKNKSIASLLKSFVYMFESHWLINDYARRVNCQIINKTKESFVDAYERS